jgi:broad specificity phosphatase PhoE
VPVCSAGELEHAEIVLVRHGETLYNTKGLLSGQPETPVPLSERGRAQSEALRPVLEAIAWGSTFCTRFGRTVDSYTLMLPGYASPQVIADLDDIDVGEFEGQSVAAYREWRDHHGIAEAPVGGESRLQVLERYARGLAWLASAAPRPVLVVTHDQPIRYLENVLAGKHPILGDVDPVRNATPYCYPAETVRTAATFMFSAVEEATTS